MKNKPLVGFLPCFDSLGETLPQINIAKKYIEKGGHAIFFWHSGIFDYLVRDINCEVIKLKDLEWKKALVGVDRLKTSYEKLLFLVYNKKTIGQLVENEIETFKKAGIDIIISSFNPTCSISARVLNIPLIVLTSGTTNSLYFRSGFATFPDNYENVFTKVVPDFIKNSITNWMLFNNKFLVKNFNYFAKKYNIRTFRSLNDILEGDYTLLCDDVNLLGIKPNKKFPKENFIGPISMGLTYDSVGEIDKDIKNHLDRPGRSILLIMGSIPNKDLFPKILEALNKTNYNIIVVYTTSPVDKLPKTKENILFKQFIKFPQIIHKMVDLAIIHGGRGTVYNAAYSGKPTIGIPVFIEQQYNIDGLVRNGAGIRITSKYFDSGKLLKAINTIFNDYDKYLKNAQELSKKLSGITNADKAVDRLIEIIEKEVKY